MYLKLKKNWLIFYFILLIISTTLFSGDASGMDCEPEPGQYTLRSVSSGGYLDGRHEEDYIRPFLRNGDPECDKYFKWNIERVDGHYALKSVSNTGYLDGRVESDIVHVGDVAEVFVTNRNPKNDKILQWNITSVNDHCALKSIGSKGFLDGRAKTDIKEYPSIQSWAFVKNGNPETDKYLQWDIEPTRQTLLDKCKKDLKSCDKSCPPPPASNPCPKVVELNIDLAKHYELFGNSFLSGAAYSLIPEIIREALVSRGHQNASNITAMIIQGGMLFLYNTTPESIIIGIGTRNIFEQLGFSHQISAAAGSIASVVTVAYKNLISSEAIIFDYMIHCAIAFTGSCAGSLFALQAKSWFWR